MAAESGCRTARYLLAEMYRDGKGLPQDYITAYQWYLLAGSDDEAVKTELKSLESRMTAADIAEAKAGAQSWLSEHN